MVDPIPEALAEPGSAYSRESEMVDLAIGSEETGQLLSVNWARSSVFGARGENASSIAEAELSELQLSSLGAIIAVASDSAASRATVQGTCCTSLTATGATTLADTVLECLLLQGQVELPVDPGPNTVVVDGAGIRIVVNEQILRGDAVGELELVVNAIHISLDEAVLDGLGIVSGEIVIGRSTAGLTCESRLRTPCEDAADCLDRQACVPDPEMSGSNRCACVGDCNLDGRVRSNEITAMINIINGIADVTTCLAADQDGDGRVRANDITMAILNINQGCPAQL